MRTELSSRPWVIHELPGRVRIRFGPLGHPRLDVEAWRSGIAAVAGVGSVRVNLVARSAEVRFDADRLRPGDVLEAAASAPVRYLGDDRRPPAELDPRRRALVTGTAAAGVAAANVVAGRSAFAVGSTSFGLTTASTLVNGYPFLRNPARALLSRAGLPPDTALWAGALVALSLRQNLLGLSVLLAGQWLAATRRAAERRVGASAPAADGRASMPGRGASASPGGASRPYGERAAGLALAAAAAAGLTGEAHRPIAALLGACPSAVILGESAPAALALRAVPPTLRVGGTAALDRAGRATSVAFDDWRPLGRFQIASVRDCGDPQRGHALALGLDPDRAAAMLAGCAAREPHAPWWAQALWQDRQGFTGSAPPAGDGLIAGEPARLRKRGYRLGPLRALCERERQEGRVPVCLLLDGRPAAVVGLEAVPLPGVIACLGEWVALGVEEVRLEGEHAARAAMERALGLDTGGRRDSEADIRVLTRSREVPRSAGESELVVRLRRPDPARAAPPLGRARLSAGEAVIEDLSGLTELIALGRRYRRATREADALTAGFGLTGLGLAASGSMGPGAASVLNNVAALAATAIAGRHFIAPGRANRAAPWQAAAEVAAAGAGDLPAPVPRESAVIPLRPRLEFGAVDGHDRGLSEREAAERLAHFGPNRLPAGGGWSIWRKLAGQFNDLSTWLLIAAAGTSWMLGSGASSALILAIVGLNAGLGVVQDARAERFARQVRMLAAPVARVERDGVVRPVDAEALVPGDVILLEPGDRVPADARLTRGTAVAVEESALTGESTPVEKTPASRVDQLYLGTTVVRGRARARVSATGPMTELGQLARSLHRATPPPSPLQERLGALSATLSWTALALCAGIGALGLSRGHSLPAILVTAVSLAVAAIPEGLPAVVTVNLALGVQALSRRNAIVRNLPAVENLGAASIVCCDKTGTLTYNRLAVRVFWTPQAGRVDAVGSERPLAEFPGVAGCLEIGALCNNAELSRGCGAGDPIEHALLQAAAGAGMNLDRLRERFYREREYPFDSDRRRMTVLCREGGGLTMFSKGALDAILPICSAVREEKGVWRAHDALTREGLRVLALARRTVAPGEEADPDRLAEDGFELAGLVGLLDPPRPDVGTAIERMRAAGIAVLLLTGDHPGTAISVAREVGIFRDGDRVLTGDQIAAFPDEALPGLTSGATVLARLSPSDKLRVVRALQRSGHVVAMVGDGVNDAPAIRGADIGVSMGTTGTDLAKGAADLILTDDRLATVVAAIEQGRSTYLNIRRSVRYLLATNAAEILLMAGAVALGLPMPLLPAQLLLINLVGDGLPVVALATEPPHAGAMREPPRARSESFFDASAARRAAADAIAMGLAPLGVYLGLLLIGRALPVARTAALASLAIGQIRYALRCRDGDAGAGNRMLSGAAALSGAALAASIHLPSPRRAFGTAPLGPFEWAVAWFSAWIAARPRSAYCSLREARRAGTRLGASAAACTSSAAASAVAP